MERDNYTHYVKITAVNSLGEAGAQSKLHSFVVRHSYSPHLHNTRKIGQVQLRGLVLVIARVLLLHYLLLLLSLRLRNKVKILLSLVIEWGPLIVIVSELFTKFSNAMTINIRI